jgi:hypothetical protein
MAKRIWLFCMALAVLGISSPTTLGKPGDLPVDITQQCPDARESVAEGWTAPDGDCLAVRPPLTLPSPLRGEVRGRGAGADAAPRVRSTGPAARDTSPRPVNQARGTHHRVRRDAHLPAMAPHDAEAARLLALGERCRQIGDHAQAAVCFEEAHLVSPTSIAGRLAIDRLREMEFERFGGPRGAAEEADAPVFARPQRPVIEPRDAKAPRQPASQPGASPERQPQPGPAPSQPNDLQKLKQMLELTVPLGGAEEQEIRAPHSLELKSGIRRD